MASKPSKPSKPSLGKQLQLARTSARLTKAAVARLAGCSVQTVTQAEADLGTVGNFLNVARASGVKVVGRLPGGVDLAARVYVAIQRRCDDQGWSHVDFAEEAHVSLSAVQRLTRRPMVGLWGRKSTVHWGTLATVASFLRLGLSLAPIGQRETFHANAGTSSQTQTWQTPLELLDKLYPLVGGTFSLDPCSPTAITEVAPVRAERYFTKDDDGLAQEWRAATVYCNPPYGRSLPPWTAKCRAEVAAGRAGFIIGLVPASTGVGWWRDNVRGHADAVFLGGRLTFRGAGATAPNASVLVVWGGIDAQRQAVRDAFPADQWVPRDDTPP